MLREASAGGAQQYAKGASQGFRGMPGGEAAVQLGSVDQGGGEVVVVGSIPARGNRRRSRASIAARRLSPCVRGNLFHFQLGGVVASSSFVKIKRLGSGRLLLRPRRVGGGGGRSLPGANSPVAAVYVWRRLAVVCGPSVRLGFRRSGGRRSLADPGFQVGLSFFRSGRLW